MLRNRWTMLAVLTLVRAAMAYQVQTVASVSPYLMADLGIDYAALGTLIGLYMLPGLVISLPGGVLGRRFGEVRLDMVNLSNAGMGIWAAQYLGDERSRQPDVGAETRPPGNLLNTFYLRCVFADYAKSPSLFVQAMPRSLFSSLIS